MTTIRMRLEGNGIEQLSKRMRRLNSQGRLKLGRELQKGGNKARTAVKRAMVDQTAIKKGKIDRSVKGWIDHANLEYTILATGKGVVLKDVQKVEGKRLRKRSSRNHPRDALGRYTTWPRSDPSAGLVSATVWDDYRTFAGSFKSKKGAFVRRLPGEPTEGLRGPSISKEAVKDNSKYTFEAQLPIISSRVTGILRKIMA